MAIINFNRIIIISVILVHINFAQTVNNITPIKIDTSKQKTTDERLEKQSIRLNELKIFYNNHFNKSQYYIPDYNLIYPAAYASPNLSYSPKNYRTTNELKLFNVSLYKLLAKEYEKRGRYDLGALGRYLGIADNIITIILWVLSFNDF